MPAPSPASLESAPIKKLHQQEIPSHRTRGRTRTDADGSCGEWRAAHFYGNVTCKMAGIHSFNCSLCHGGGAGGKLQNTMDSFVCSVLSVCPSLLLPDPGFFLVPEGE